MIKRWLVKCAVNMDASNEANVILKANSERNAKSKAINDLYARGYFHVEVLSCEEMTDGLESKVMIDE